MGKAVGGLIAFLGVVVAVLTWLFPDPLSINDDARPGPAGTVNQQQADKPPAGQTPAGNTRPNIEISPDSGPPGTRVTVTGTGFPASAEVEITFHLDKIGETRSDGDGAFRVTVRVPTDIPTKDFPWGITATATPYSDREAFRVT